MCWFANCFHTLNGVFAFCQPFISGKVRGAACEGEALHLPVSLDFTICHYELQELTKRINLLMQSGVTSSVWARSQEHSEKVMRRKQFIFGKHFVKVVKISGALFTKCLILP